MEDFDHMTLGEIISKVVVEFFDKDTAVHSKHILNENVENVNNSFYDIPEYRVDYFFNTFPVFIIYLVSHYDNANYVNRFMQAVDRWPAHDSLSFDNYPSNKIIHTYDYDDESIVNTLIDKLTKTSEIIIDARYGDMFSYRSSRISEDHKYMIGAVVDKFALFFKMLTYETTFHKYRNLIDFIYKTQLEYEYYRFKLDTGEIDQMIFNQKTYNLDISDQAIADYLWYRDGDFYDTMFNTGYTGSEWNM